MKRRNAGSKKQCLIFTENPAEGVIARINQLVDGFAKAEAGEIYFPKGENLPREARLGERKGLLADEHRKAVSKWWLAVSQRGRWRANTPNWDIASTCTIDSHRGVILVEAKAHHGEFGSGKNQIKDLDNQRSISTAIADANRAMRRISPEWNLTADSHYQLCNRFAWAWKVASLGVPVILVYLGFLNVTDMPGRILLKTAEDWKDAMYKHAEGIVPRDAWGKELDVNGTPLIPLVRSWPAA
jgi:hypothetical protein